MNGPIITATEIEAFDARSDDYKAVRAASDHLHGLVKGLPQAQHLLLEPDALKCFLLLEEREPKVCLLLLEQVRTACGPYVMRVLERELKHSKKTLPEPGPVWPEPLDLEKLAEHDPQPPRFILEDWLPCGYASLFAGHGGVGKSGIALHLAVCIAAGLPFFGNQTHRRRVLYLSCEDRASMLHWRLTRICAYLGIDLASLRGKLNVLDLVGHQTILWERQPYTGAALTAAYGELSQLMRFDEHVADSDQRLLMVDGISDAYGGNENNRAEVKQFINTLLMLIHPDAGGLLLVGHIAKPAASGIVTSEGYSGSTAWHNAARARWYLFPETTEAEAGERPERTGDLILELQKSNFGATDRSLRFRWDAEAHLFLADTTPAGSSGIVAAIQRGNERKAVLKLLAECETIGRQVHASPHASTGAATILGERPGYPNTLRGKTGKKALQKLLRQLEEDGCIRQQIAMNASRHSIMVWILTDAGKQEIAA